MKTETIQLRLTNSKNNSVKAYLLNLPLSEPRKSLLGKLYIHHPVNLSGEPFKNTWRITHGASGRTIYKDFVSRKEAMERTTEYLEGLNIDSIHNALIKDVSQS